VSRNNTHTLSLLRVDVRDLLDSTFPARALMLDGNGGAVGTLSKLLDELVLRVDDECRVESGESVPSHDLRVLTCGSAAGEQPSYDSAPLRWRTRKENVMNWGDD